MATVRLSAGEFHYVSYRDRAGNAAGTAAWAAQRLLDLGTGCPRPCRRRLQGDHARSAWAWWQHPHQHVLAAKRAAGTSVPPFSRDWMTWIKPSAWSGPVRADAGATDLDHFRILRQRDRAGGLIHEYRLVA